jgi:hypothetical protein
MGKQIGFLQTQADINGFVKKINELGMIIYECALPPREIDDYNEITELVCGKHRKYYVALEGKLEILEKTRLDGGGYLTCPRSSSVFEYSLPEIYKKNGQLDIISSGRLWIDEKAYGHPIYKKFEELRKWIKKHYRAIPLKSPYMYYYAPDILEQIRCGKIIAACNSGRRKTIDENLMLLMSQTWLCDCKNVDGEWVGSADPRYYK